MATIPLQVSCYIYVYITTDLFYPLFKLTYIKLLTLVNNLFRYFFLLFYFWSTFLTEIVMEWNKQFSHSDLVYILV